MQNNKGERGGSENVAFVLTFKLVRHIFFTEQKKPQNKSSISNSKFRIDKYMAYYLIARERYADE